MGWGIQARHAGVVAWRCKCEQAMRTHLWSIWLLRQEVRVWFLPTLPWRGLRLPVERDSGDGGKAWNLAFLTHNH